MAQFTFICVDEDKCKTTMEFEAIFLPHVVDKMEEFLKGTGFYFDELTFSKPDDSDDSDDLTDHEEYDRLSTDDIKVGLTAVDDDTPGDPSY